MNIYFKQIYTLLCLLGSSLPSPLWAQSESNLKIQPVVWEVVRICSTDRNEPLLKDREYYANAFYDAAQVAVEFDKALKLQQFTKPAHNNTCYYLSLFPDTTHWQKKEKQEMRLELADALVKQKIGPNVIFVRKGGIGNGSSWRQAFGDLQQALANVKPGQEIWVAAGTYFPTQEKDRNASFVIPDSVRLFGGFAGNESDRYQRHWDKNLTILSGEIGTERMDDNSYTVVYTEQVGRHTLLDGFVITGGHADGVQQLGDPRRSGGGWYNDGAGGASNPMVTNCLFIHNYARNGAGFYSFAKDGQVNPTFIDCQFINNRADLDGGGLFIDSREGNSEAKIIHCFFSDNRANFGSAIGNRSEFGRSVLFIEKSVFETNIAYVREVIYDASNGNDGEDINFLKLERACRFADNVSVVGENENTSAAKNQSKKLKRGEIAYLAF